MNEKVFTDGIIYKEPREGAPDFLKGTISFKTDEAIAWIKQHTENGWCNIDLLVSRAGKPYAALNTFKPKEQTEQPEYSPKTDPKHNGGGGQAFSDDIPFSCDH